MGSVAKVLEISSQSEKSFQDAVELGIARVCKTVEDVKGIWIKEQMAQVKDGKITEYRVDMKVTFILKE